MYQALAFFGANTHGPRYYIPTYNESLWATDSRQRRAGCITWIAMTHLSRVCLPLLLLSLLAALFGVRPAAGQTTYQWNLNSGGDWGTAANWSPNTNFPGNSSASYDIADFGGDPVGGYAVNISTTTSSVYLNQLNFNRHDGWQ